MTTTDTDETLRERFRRAEPAFVRAVARALGPARTVLELRRTGASYAPTDRAVTRVPDAATGLPAGVDRTDAALAAFPVDAEGPAALRRSTDGPVVVLARDPDRLRTSWLAEYAPEVVAADADALPTLTALTDALGGAQCVEVLRLPIPFTCVDGFAEAYYARPERLLDPAARAADPAWAAVDDITARRSVAALRTALASGAWDDRHGALRRSPTHDGSVLLLRAVGIAG